MKIERLRNKTSKLIFLCGFVMVVVLLITVVFKGSKAKYRNSNIIPLINTKVKNNVPDFTVMGIYLNDGGPITGADGKKYTKKDKNFPMPSTGYVINETNSYCEKFDTSKNQSVRDTNVKIYTNILGKNSIEGVSSGDKCHLFFDTGTNKYISAKQFLLGMWGYEDISTITERPASDFTETPKVMITGRDTTNNRDWLYKAPDDDGTSYYLAGNPQYNWVKFGGYYWRIVRINGDGSIRMIYSGTGTPAEKGEGTLLSKNEVASISDDRNYQYNPTYNNAIYVGYWYTEGELHGKTTASPIYYLVNSFYEKNLKKYDSYIDKNAGFCNDRTLAADNPAGSTGYGTTLTNFAPRKRMVGSSMTGPILTCPDKINDLFTATSSSKGNKVLANPIGLLTVDEAGLAGLVFIHDGENADNYLYTGNRYWTMSPYEFGYDYNSASIYIVVEEGAVANNYVPNYFGIRPVINLVKDIKFSKGNGSINSPFEI